MVVEKSGEAPALAFAEVAMLGWVVLFQVAVALIRVISQSTSRSRWLTVEERWQLVWVLSLVFGRASVGPASRV